jgi:hypothetical protein
MLPPPFEHTARFVRAALKEVKQPHQFFYIRTVGSAAGLSKKETDDVIAELLKEKRIAPPIADERSRFTDANSGDGIDWAIDVVRQLEAREGGSVMPRNPKFLQAENSSIDKNITRAERRYLLKAKEVDEDINWAFNWRRLALPCSMTEAEAEKAVVGLRDKKIVSGGRASDDYNFTPEGWKFATDLLLRHRKRQEKLKRLKWAFQGLMGLLLTSWVGEKACDRYEKYSATHPSTTTQPSTSKEPQAARPTTAPTSQPTTQPTTR